MTKKLEVFSPGEYIKDELDARELSCHDFALILGYPSQMVKDIIDGNISITEEIAKVIGKAFGTSSQVEKKYDNYRKAL